MVRSMPIRSRIFMYSGTSASGARIFAVGAIG